MQNDRGERFFALAPTLAEYVLEMPRGAQVIYPKDLALIVLWADIFPGARVAEAGTGSGALTMVLVRAVGPAGHVFSYDVREDFSARAASNVERYLGATETLTVRIHDVTEGIPDAPVDRVILDLPEPWRVVAPAAAALAPGGLFCSYVPTVPQVQQTVASLRAQGGFALIETIEALVRPWNVDGQSVRPVHRMVAHTGFLTVARRILPRERPGEPGPDAAEPRAGEQVRLARPPGHAPALGPDRPGAAAREERSGGSPTGPAGMVGVGGSYHLAAGHPPPPCAMPAIGPV